MSDKRYKEWLAGLKVGDSVIVLGQARYTPSKVIKVTPNGGLRIKGYTSRMFKRGMVPATEQDTSYTLCEPTKELIDIINVSRMRSYLKNAKWDKIDDYIVKRVRELLR